MQSVNKGKSFCLFYSLIEFKYLACNTPGRDHPFAIKNQLKQHRKNYSSIFHLVNSNNLVFKYLTTLSSCRYYGCNLGVINTISVRDTAMNISFTLSKWYKYYS